MILCFLVGEISYISKKGNEMRYIIVKIVIFVCKRDLVFKRINLLIDFFDKVRWILKRLRVWDNFLVYY